MRKEKVYKIKSSENIWIDEMVIEIFFLFCLNQKKQQTFFMRLEQKPKISTFAFITESKLTEKTLF